MPFKFSSSVMKVGNSLVIVLPKPLCEGLGISKGDVLTIFAEDRGIFIPIGAKKDTDVEKEFAKQIYSEH